MPESRQLAAIMFSDIEGYTRMMETDEQEGRIKAKHYRKILDQQLSLHGGEVIQNYGDGSLSIFQSVVEAVKCAYAIQLELKKDPQVPLRIGVHLGDIVVDDEDIYGAGVNLASRIESMGVAGSVLVSNPVYNQIKNHTEFRLTSLGRFEFKNVEDPMEVYALENEGLIVPERGILKGKFKEKTRKRSPLIYLLPVLLLLAIGWWSRQNFSVASSEIHSMAVLPLVSLSKIADQEILSQGVHEGLISALGQLSTVSVIAKPSTIPYTQSNKPLSEISKELSVDGIITGSIFLTGDSVNLGLQLVKTYPREKQIWSRQYAGKISEVLKIYQEVSRDIAASISVRLSSDRGAGPATKAGVDPETYKAYVRGMYFLNKSTPEDLNKGMEYLLQAVEIDPADPLVYTGLATGYAILGHGPDPDDRVWKRGRAAAMQAIKLDSTVAEAHAVLAIIKFYYEWDWAGAEKGFLKALEINPSLAIAHFHYAWYLAAFGDFKEAIKEHQLSKELDPLTPIYTVDMGSLYLWAGELDKAMDEVIEGLELDPEFGHGNWVLGNVYAGQQRYDKAIEAHQKASAIHPVWKGALAGTYALAGQKDKAREILSELKEQDLSPRIAFWITYIYLTLGDFDEVFRWLEYRSPDPWIVTIRTWPEFKVLHQDPRFHAFLKKMNLPPV